MFKDELYGLSNDNESTPTTDYITQRYVYALSELAVGGRCKYVLRFYYLFPFQGAMDMLLVVFSIKLDGILASMYFFLGPNL